MCARLLYNLIHKSLVNGITIKKHLFILCVFVYVCISEDNQLGGVGSILACRPQGLNSCQTLWQTSLINEPFHWAIIDIFVFILLYHYYIIKSRCRQLS